MSQNSSLAVIGDSEWQVLQQQAKALVDSGFLPASVNSPQKAVAIMMLGRELGIPPWAALSTINVIQGKPTVSPQLMLALINRSKQLEDMTISASASECVVMMKRKGRTLHTETFTMQNATALQLTGKDNYKKQPATMLKWRAVAACARVVFPDVVLGLYTHEEMGADVEVDDEGNMTVIDVAPEPMRQLEAPAQPSPKPEPPSQPIPPTGNGQQNDGSEPPLFPDEAPADLGAIDKLPRDVNGLPILGSLNMKELGKLAQSEKLVSGQRHFANLIDVLWKEGSIRAASKPEAVMEAIRKHEAEKDLAKEGSAAK